jgi:hypothetical protein
MSKGFVERRTEENTDKPFLQAATWVSPVCYLVALFIFHWVAYSVVKSSGFSAARLLYFIVGHLGIVFIVAALYLLREAKNGRLMLGSTSKNFIMLSIVLNGLIYLEIYHRIPIVESAVKALVTAMKAYT